MLDHYLTVKQTLRASASYHQTQWVKLMRYQRNLGNRRLAILVLPFASWPKLEEHKSKIVAAIVALQAGDYLEVTLP